MHSRNAWERPKPLYRPVVHRSVEVVVRVVLTSSQLMTLKLENPRIYKGGQRLLFKPGLSP
eukprot:4212399-Pyramimonas_sp.AAC.1